MATLKYLATERAHLAQVPISEGQFTYTTDTNEVFYDVAHDIRFKTNKLKLVDTDTERYRLSNNDQVSTDLIYYIKESELFYVWTGAWKNVVATTEITRFLGDYKNVTPTTLVKGEERYAPMTIASQVYTDDGETLEAKVRQISHIASAFDSIAVTKKGKTFDIPVPFERYFDQPNMLLVFIGTLQIYPNRYSIEGNQITFQEEVEAGRTINFYFIYNAQAPKLETMNYIDGAYLNKGTVPIDRMQKYSHSYTSNDTTSVASSAAVKSLYDKMNALLDRGGIITRCVTKDDNVNMGTTLPNEYKLLDGNVISVRFHTNVGDNPTLRVDGKAIPIFVGFEPAKANEIQAGDELYLQYDYISERFYVTNGLPYLIDSTTYSYAVLADGENVFRFNTLNYDPGVDRLEVFHNGVRLIQGKNYKFIAESKSISLVGYTADKGDVIEIVVYKVARSRATNNSQVTITRPDFESLTRSLGETIEDLKRRSQVAQSKSLDVIFPKFGPRQEGDQDKQDIGDCTIVGVDKKYWFIIDCFNNSIGDGGINSIKATMRDNNITKFEFLLITHWHKDHYGNAIRLMNEKLVEKVYVQDVSKYPNGIPGTFGMPAQSLKDMYNSHKTAADRNAIRMTPAPTGEEDFHGATLLFHNNSEDDIRLHNADWVGGDYNNTCIGLTVSYIGRNFVTQADGGLAMMNRFAPTLPANVDLLKSNHHSITNMPWSFKKLNPTDAVVTANKYQIATDALRFNYQSNLFDMGANVYLLGNQAEDIHITYKADNDSVSYNNKLTRAYPDNSAYQLTEANGQIFVNKDYTGDVFTGDKATPVKYLSDAVRLAHMDYMKEIVINIAPGNYVDDFRNYNFVNPGYNIPQRLQFIGLKGKVRIVNGGTDPVILPAIYISNSDQVVFENITFDIGALSDTYIRDISAFSNIEIINASAKFINCRFINMNSKLADKINANNGFYFFHIDAFTANVQLQNCTYSGKATHAIRSAEGSCVNVTGSNNVVDANIPIVYYATDGDIYVNGTANKNTANETGGGGTVRFQEVGTNVWQTGTTRGQIIGTRLSQRYGGPQYYISDGRGGYDSMDHFNIHGNTNMTPSFTGQFGYDPRSKKVKFAVGNSNINDWVEFANSETLEATKTNLTNLVNTTKDTLTQTVNDIKQQVANTLNSDLVRYIELQSGYRLWTNGAVFAKGEKFIYQGKAYQVVSNNAVNVSDNNANTLRSNSNIIGAVINLEGNSVVQYFDRDDAHLVGELVLLPYKANGYILADGSEVAKSRYPRLYDFVENNGLWTTDTNKRGLFRKSGSDKFFLPDYRYVYLKADVDADDIGKFAASSAPRITGEMAIRSDGVVGIEYASGAFVKDTELTKNAAYTQELRTNYGKKLKFDASRSSSVYSGGNSIHPDHINLYPLIKY